VPYKFLVERCALLSAEGSHLPRTIPSSFESRKKTDGYRRVSSGHQHYNYTPKSFAPLLSISRIIGSCTRSPRSAKSVQWKSHDQSQVVAEKRSPSVTNRVIQLGLKHYFFIEHFWEVWDFVCNCQWSWRLTTKAPKIWCMIRVLASGRLRHVDIRQLFYETWRGVVLSELKGFPRRTSVQISLPRIYTVLHLESTHGLTLVSMNTWSIGLGAEETSLVDGAYRRSFQTA
jgi:hypothetical protein